MADETQVEAQAVAKAAAEAPAKVAEVVAETVETVVKEGAKVAKRTQAAATRRVKREAAAQKNDDYVKLNEKLLAELSK